MALHSVTAPPPADLFRSTKTPSTKLRVDRKKNVIYGASLMQFGRVNDSRPWHVDAMTLDQVVELAAERNKGLKARFTHPNMSNDGLGYFLGNWRNVTHDGEFARGDLHFAQAAFNSPHGDLATYLLDMAEESPEDFGISLAGRINEEAMNRTAAAHAEGLQAIRWKRLSAADFVDEPAATRTGLFAMGGSVADLPAMATRFMDHYFSAADPATVRSKVTVFLDQYLSTRKGTDDMATQADLDAKDAQLKAKEAELEKTKADLAAKDAELKKATDAAAAKDAADKAAKDKSDADLSAQQKQQIERDAVLAENKRVTEITALCNAAGFPELVEQFTKVDGATKFTVEQAKSELFDATLRRDKAIGGEGDKTQKKSSDPEKRFGKEYDEQAETHLANGITRERYIHSRKIDEGLAAVGSKPAEKK